VSNIVFDTADLSALGLVTRGVSGVHDLVASVTDRVWVPGKLQPDDAVIRDSDLGQMEFDCAVIGTDHADLITNLSALKAAANPRKGWKFFTITDLSGLRTLALPGRFPVNLDKIPYVMHVAEFNWGWERVGYWEDASEQSKVISGLSDTVSNDGDLVTYPIWQCELTGDMPDGLSFQVTDGTNIYEYVYDGELVTGNVLLVKTDLATPVLDGSTDFANTDSESDYPPLAVGVNTVTRESTDYTLTCLYRRRFE